MTGKFNLIYADWPWQFKPFDRETGLGKSADQHFPTMTLAEMAALPVAAMSATNCHLVSWVYDPMLPQAMQLAEILGFKFITVLFRWFKTTDGQMRLFDPTPRPGFGTGYHSRGGACEEAWLFKRGKGLPVLRHDIRKEFFAPIREHSRKPDEVPGWLVDLYGNVPRIELFARTRRPGWEAFGNEIDKFKTRVAA